MNSKIKSRDEIIKIVSQIKQNGKTAGFTSGAFDILHSGHIDYLYKAKKKCDVLILGLNTDDSIKRYKDPNRPINSQDKRVKVISALEMVDYVFLFDETNNNLNIELIKPSFYIKAGDYSKDKLTSAPIIEKYGGKVILIPVEEDTSTTKTIKRLIELEQSIEISKPTQKIKAIFLDRDGTINKDISYLHEPDKFEFEQNAPEGLKKFQEMGYKLIIVTDQPGIGLGYFTKEDFYKVNGQMFKLLAPYNVKIDRIYFCPHSIEDNCDCRKPKTGLLKRALESYSGMIDIENSYFIGDKTSDIKCGANFGLKTVLVKTGSAGKDNRYSEVKPTIIAENLLDASDKIN